MAPCASGPLYTASAEPIMARNAGKGTRMAVLDRYKQIKDRIAAAAARARRAAKEVMLVAVTTVPLAPTTWPGRRLELACCL